MAALVPGVSRSGTIITMGLFLGSRREEEARFPFLMSVPVTSAAALSLAEVLNEGMDAHEVWRYGFLLNYLARHSLRLFAYYRFALAAVVAVAPIHRVVIVA